MLDDLDAFLQVAPATYEATPKTELLWCPQCHDMRRMLIRRVPPEPAARAMTAGSRGPLSNRTGPELFTFACVQCDLGFTAVIYDGSMGRDLVVIPAAAGGQATEHTPGAVAYYLDQAARSDAMGARTAALVMYRSAVEQLMADQGFDARMLGPKIDQLEKAIASQSAPDWGTRIDPAFISVLNKLGNFSAHDSDVERHAQVDPMLLHDVKETVRMLLEEVYEEPARRRARRDALADRQSELTGQAKSED